MSNNHNDGNTVTKMEPLIPCPFCGGEADEEFNEETLTLYVQCTKCWARGTAFRGHGYAVGPYLDDMRREARAAWNKRYKEE